MGNLLMPRFRRWQSHAAEIAYQFFDSSHSKEVPKRNNGYHQDHDATSKQQALFAV